jgi:SH3-like domain-containing protein
MQIKKSNPKLAILKNILILFVLHLTILFPLLEVQNACAEFKTTKQSTIKNTAQNVERNHRTSVKSVEFKQSDNAASVTTKTYYAQPQRASNTKLKVATPSENAKITNSPKKNSNITSPTKLVQRKFAALKSDNVNLRAGPGTNYPIKYHICCKGYPVQIIAEFEHWRLVRDVKNNTAWVKTGILTTRSKNAIIQMVNTENNGNKSVNMMRLPNAHSPLIAKVEEGVIVQITKCYEEYCKVIAKQGKNHQGWIKKKYLWGMLPAEKD